MILKFCIAALLGSTIALAQSPQKAPASIKPPEFEVVSIHPSRPGESSQGFQILPDGFRVRGIGLWINLARAYFPNEDLYSPDRLKGQPSWVNNQMFDIEARVAPADVAEWQKQGPQNKLLQAMLQQMLAERCKLVVHRIPTEIDGDALVVAKGGPRLKPTPPNEVFPSGKHASAGGESIGYRPGEKPQITFYGTSMEGLAFHLTHMSFNNLVLDRTGLPGAYDFVLAHQSADGASDDGPVVVRPTDGNPLANWDLKSLGLELKLIKIATETIVIDHIEKPSEN